MRIAYVAVHLEKKLMTGGVGAKIKTQVRLWRENGHDVRLFLLTPDGIEIPGASIFRFSSPVKLPFLKFAAKEFSRFIELSRLVESVRAFNPDVIYLRYGLFALPLQKLFDVAPVVVELNSNDVDEYRSRGAFFFQANRLTRGITLGRAAGWVVTSHEIGSLPVNQGFKNPRCVIANGIDFDAFTPLPAPKNDRPVIAFVGTPGYRWHGVDKLHDLALACADIKFDVIGYQADDQASKPANIVFHGFLGRDDYMKILAGADVSCGSLALHRNNMQEASPLKVRESLAYGVPMILPFMDTDLHDLDADFLLRLPNTEDNVRSNADAIREFAHRMRGRRVDRAVIFPRLDQRRKEQARLAFFSQILESRGKNP
jgi:glycosyltransferase involved in cell wall biosynthesis